MNKTFEPSMDDMSLPMSDIVQSVCKRIPPLWSLKNFVAVNPFLGLSDRHFMEAARLMQHVGHGEMLMRADFYLNQITSGRIQREDVDLALKVARKTLPGEWSQQINIENLGGLNEALQEAKHEVPLTRVLTFAEFLDAESRSHWAAFIVEEISKWCSAYFDQGQSSWRMPWRDLGLFAAWKEAAKLDANPELAGLTGFRDFVGRIPENPLVFIQQALGKMAVPAASKPDFLHRQWMSLPGWSSYVQYIVREKGMSGQVDDSLIEFLAIRLAYDLALHEKFGRGQQLLERWVKKTSAFHTVEEKVSPGLLIRYLAQQSLECAYQRKLIAQLKGNSPIVTSVSGKTLQAVFCIDVRSEIFRRALEAQSDEIETIGFAGFFGIAMDYVKFGETSGAAQCPVLLTPRITVRETLHPEDSSEESRLLKQMKFHKAFNSAWNSFKTSAISCFSFVETAGLWFGVKLIRDSLALPTSNEASTTGVRGLRLGPKIGRESSCTQNHDHGVPTGIDIADQVSMAAGALRNMGLTSDFAKVVLICGHGSSTTNNPYGSALDCGACGGHAGDANARVAADILNQPEVREALRLQNIDIPSETVFVAGLHNTTTDEITIFDPDNLFVSQEASLAKIKTWLKMASKQARLERAPSLGLGASSGSQLDEQVITRSRDWSQVRPEWGLAGNAAFIAAPRERTKNFNLGGRAFLHNYRAGMDPEKSTLELIMVAPMVVASWINLQYYGSTVNNRLFGSGNKVLHNLVGTFGVWQGNGGDLQPGLPLQSVHDGVRWMHEPLRLNVFIEAECDAIQSILLKQPGVKELITNGWVNLFAMEASGPRIWRYCGNQFMEETEL